MISHRQEHLAYDHCIINYIECSTIVDYFTSFARAHQYVILFMESKKKVEKETGPKYFPSYNTSFGKTHFVLRKLRRE